MHRSNGARRRAHRLSGGVVSAAQTNGAGVTISASYHFHNAAVLITGAGSGIGAALARHCAQAGATVIAVDRKHDRLLEGLPPAIAHNIDLQRVDVSDHAAVAAMVSATRKRHPRLDAAVLG